jgi:hypothetical protein
LSNREVLLNRPGSRPAGGDPLAPVREPAVIDDQ